MLTVIWLFCVDKYSFVIFHQWFCYFCVDSNFGGVFWVDSDFVIFVLTGMALVSHSVSNFVIFVFTVIWLFLCWQVYPWSLLQCQWEPLDWRDMETTSCEYIYSQNCFVFFGDLFHEIQLYRARCIMHEILF